MWCLFQMGSRSFLFSTLNGSIFATTFAQKQKNMKSNISVTESRVKSTCCVGLSYLLPQVVVNSVHFFILQRVPELRCKHLSAPEVMSKRLLQHHPQPRPAGRPTTVIDLISNIRICKGWYWEVEEPPRLCHSLLLKLLLNVLGQILVVL